ncbi:ATP/GTP-binding protein [Slackia heliotrinireducens]|uniref:ATP/GTP-binding protein n=1 Tax=Slackia heliotrinireducens TaxID=84110 RepID=UPI003314F408
MKRTPRIITVVLTGGPCGGKSTAERLLHAHAWPAGWQVVFVEESATALIKAGVTRESCGEQYAFQCCVIERQLVREQDALELARQSDSDTVVVFDRGVPDSDAYLAPAEYRQALATYGMTPESALLRYDVVFHLVTCAIGAEDHYETTGNAARRETLAQAAAVDARHAASWSAHPRLVTLRNGQGFDAKMDALIEHIQGLMRS